MWGLLNIVFFYIIQQLEWTNIPKSKIYDNDILYYHKSWIQSIYFRDITLVCALGQRTCLILLLSNRMDQRTSNEQDDLMYKKKLIEQVHIMCY